MVATRSKLAVLAILMMAIARSESSSNLRKKRNRKLQHNTHQQREGEDAANTPYPRRDTLEGEPKKNGNNERRDQGITITFGAIQTTTTATPTTTTTATTTTTTTGTTTTTANGNKGLTSCKAIGQKAYGYAFGCDIGGQPNQPLSLQNFPQDTFGTCQTMHPCLCGLSVQIAKNCPCLCRPYCGGGAMTQDMCPDGFALRPDGSPVKEFDYAKVIDDFNGQWPYWLGYPAAPPPWTLNNKYWVNNWT